MNKNNQKTKITPFFDLIEDAFIIWWRNLKKIIFVYLWAMTYALIPLGVLVFISLFVAWQGNINNLSLRLVLVLLSLMSILALIYFSIRGYASIFILVKKHFNGQPRDIFKESGKIIWPYIALTLLTVLFVMLWTLALIVPGIIYSVFYSLAVYAFFFEDLRGRAALRRSRELIRGYFWPVVGRYLLLGLIIWVFDIIISAPLNSMIKHSNGWEIWNTFVQIINYLISPIALLFSYQIYKDLVIIKNHDPKD